MTRVILLLALCSCANLNHDVSCHWPITPQVAHANVAPYRDGAAWVVDDHHRLTSLSVCEESWPSGDEYVEATDKDADLCLLYSKTSLGDEVGLPLANHAPTINPHAVVQSGDERFPVWQRSKAGQWRAGSPIFYTRGLFDTKPSSYGFGDQNADTEDALDAPLEYKSAVQGMVVGGGRLIGSKTIKQFLIKHRDVAWWGEPRNYEGIPLYVCAGICDSWR